MKSPISDLQKIFESRIRLGIMSALMVNETLDFNTLKDLLRLTDGNLASHMKTLEHQKIIEVSKEFIGRKPNTSFKATDYGKKLFRQHLSALEEFIRNH